MRKVFIILSIAIIFALNGCSDGKSVTQVEYNKLKTELDTANSKNEELETEIANLKDQITSLDAENETHKIEITPSEIPEVELTNEELEEKLKEQPMFVISTDYIVQDEKYKSLYPDMLNAVIQNASGKEIKNAKVAFVAWDKNNLPVKIVGQYELNDGSYINEVDFGDVNMIDGDTFGEGKGMTLSEDCNNIKTIKAIIFEYTDFDGNTWENPYYQTWKSAYENKKLLN